ncbi:transposable element Tcb2 transposase [Trichonephila inaurata madagascariensis]|uniref:Transposable element Tcb2 transposase n=1 Tax=Trichonephila inaurata madagascariensis TaxID=2747483 RepID=A0A8X6X244_9ARAC|nr:transposable element Tcb2 transposase [Trichonephila inaurata madagascariensis]
MSSHNRLEDDLKWSAIGCIEGGMLQRVIIKGTVVRRLGQGRSKAATPTEDRFLTINGRCHRHMIAKELTKDFSAASGMTISKQTAHKRIAEKTFYAQRPVICVSLNLSQQKARLLLSREHVSWAIQEFTGYLRFCTKSDSR